MNYQETLDFMFAQLPMYHRIGAAAYKADIQPTVDMMAALGNPERKFRSIHVAGTNGKGSVSHFLASILQEAGYKVGLYTSPHLVDFRERIRINGEMIPKEDVVDFVEAHRQLFADLHLSFFEMTVGMAFDYFAKEKVDIAVVEVGMGGRLDSTNVITPMLSVITNIGLDHTQFLGDTLEKIAVEKAGIIKPGVPVVIGETQPETKPVFERIAAERHAPITFADQHWHLRVDGNNHDESRLLFDVQPLERRLPACDCDEKPLSEWRCGLVSQLAGSYQLKNLATVFEAVDLLRGNSQFSIPNWKTALPVLLTTPTCMAAGRLLPTSHLPSAKPPITPLASTPCSASCPPCASHASMSSTAASTTRTTARFLPTFIPSLPNSANPSTGVSPSPPSPVSSPWPTSSLLPATSASTAPHSPTSRMP